MAFNSEGDDIMEKLKPEIENNIVRAPSPPPVWDKDLVKEIYKKLQESGDSVIITDGSNDRSTTASGFIREVALLANSLQDKLGVRPGDVVALSTENRPYYLVIVAAVWGVGATVGCVNHLYVQDEVTHVLRKMTPKVAFCTENVVSLFKTSQADVPTLQSIVSFGEASQEIRYSDLITDVAIRKDFDWTIPVSLDDVGLMLCSSGTTGLPKVVELTYNNVQSSITGLSYMYHDDKKPPICLTFIPLFHGFGFLTAIETLLRKGHNVTLPRFDLTKVLQTCTKYKVETMFMVPPVMVLMAKHPLLDELDLSALRVLRYGAAPCSPSVIEAINRRLPQVLCKEGYGMTESSVICCIVPKNVDHPINSVGLVVCGTQLKVIDIETGASLGPNQEGEICVRGVQTMRGYRFDKQATEAMIDAEGWLHTGDVGCYNKEGWVFVRERIKEIIKYNAMQVSPTELETIIFKVNGVKDVAVWGKPDEVAGELPMAFVVLQPGATTTEADICAYVADHVTSYKRLRGGVTFVEEIPKLASGKILRRKLGSLLPKEK